VRRRRRRGAGLDEIERVYRERGADFYRFAYARTGDANAARDAVQEGFATAVRKRRSFRSDGPLEAWVWRIVLNAARTQARRRRPDAGLRGSEPLTQTVSEEGEVRAAVAGLPERQRLAVYLRYYADLDYRAIAAILEVEVGTISATLSGAHRKLRKEIQEVLQ
jgi:RNA polymerase sigma-70 factor (ECF subfamily)